MNPYDLANNLAGAIRRAPEYAAFKEAQNVIKQDAGALEMLTDFRRQQLQLQKQQLAGLEIAPEQQEKLQKLSEILSMNLTIKRYLEAEYRLTILMHDIQKIVLEPFGELIDPALLDLGEKDDKEKE